jgi:hypothetical protein
VSGAAGDQRGRQWVARERHAVQRWPGLKRSSSSNSSRSPYCTPSERCTTPRERQQRRGPQRPRPLPPPCWPLLARPPPASALIGPVPLAARWPTLGGGIMLAVQPDEQQISKVGSRPGRTCGMARGTAMRAASGRHSRARAPHVTIHGQGPRPAASYLGGPARHLRSPTSGRAALRPAQLPARRRSPPRARWPATSISSTLTSPLCPLPRGPRSWCPQRSSRSDERPTTPSGGLRRAAPGAAAAGRAAVEGPLYDGVPAGAPPPRGCCTVSC